MICLSTVSRGGRLCFLAGVAEWVVSTRMFFDHSGQRVPALLDQDFPGGSPMGGWEDLSGDR